MRTPALRLAAAAGLLVAGLPSVATATSPPATQRFIVVLQDGGGDPATLAAAAASRHGGTVDLVYRSALHGYAISVPATRLSRLRSDPGVAYVVPDAVGDAALGKPAPPPPPQVLPTGVDRVDGDTTGPRGTVNADIAIADTGVARHPDLNLVGGYWCGQGSASGYDTDAKGHGTHVAGTAAAVDNSIGVVGTAPGARLWSLRIPDRHGTWTLSAAICALDWIAAKKDPDGRPTIEVVNASWRWMPGMTGYPGAPGPSDASCGNAQNDPLHTAVCRLVRAGITFVAAAGNESADAHVNVPAGYAEAFTVSALADFDGKAGGLAAPTCRTDVDDTMADFSSFGADVDIMAPGVCITSTAPGGGVQVMSGTSMAAPHVTGAVALYLASHPGATPADVQRDLVLRATPQLLVDDPDGMPEPLLDLTDAGS